MSNVKKTQILFVMIIVALIFGSGCAGDVYRRSTLAPTAFGGLATQKLDRGEIDVAGSVSTVDVQQQSSRLGESDVHVAHTNGHAYVRYGASDEFSFGLQGQFSHLAFSHPLTKKTLPLDDEAAYGLGPIVTAHFRIYDRLNLDLMGSATLLRSPVKAIGYHTKSPCFEEVEDCDSEYEPFSLEPRIARALLYRLQAGPSYQLTNSLTVFTGVSMQNSLSNIGSTDDTSRQGSTVGSNHHYLVGYAGGTYQHETGLYLQMQAFVTNDERTSPLGGQLTLGWKG
jgi:hypothetical protein